MPEPEGVDAGTFSAEDLQLLQPAPSKGPVAATPRQPASVIMVTPAPVACSS